MSNKKALLTTREVVELLPFSRRTLYRWIKKGFIRPHLQYVGGTHLRFLFLCSEIIELINHMPRAGAVEDPKILDLLAQRRAHMKKVRARGKGRPQGEIVEPGAE